MQKKLLILGLVLCLFGGMLYSYRSYAHIKQINSYEECVNRISSKVSGKPPNTCITALGAKYEKTLEIIEDLPQAGNYHNEFTFTVPEGWVKDGSITIVYTNYDAAAEKPFPVGGYDNPKYKIDVATFGPGSYEYLIEEYMQNNMDARATIKESDITMDSQSATLIENDSEYGDISSVLVQNPRNGHTYVFHFYLGFEDNKPLRDQILASFRFSD
jgi:hypothetical protein